MLHISVCEDDPVQQSMLAEWVREWGRVSGTELSLDTFDTSGQFLFHWEDKLDVDLLLLDIEMPGMDGMTLAHTLRERGGTLQIIFVTGRPEYVYEGYDVDAAFFLVKPLKKERLRECLAKAVKLLGTEEPMLLVEGAGEIVRVKVKEISYLESDGHDTVVHLKEGEIRSRRGIKYLEEELGGKSGLFFKLHRSFLVSLAHIQKITKKEVWMDNGAALPIPRGKWEPLNQAYLGYYGKNF